MSLNNLELPIAKLKRIIQTNLVRLNAESAIVEREIFNLFSSIEAILEQEAIAEKCLPLITTFIQYVPLAIAILDREMNYLAISDRWISDYKLEGKDIIGRNHYDVFPKLEHRWQQNYQRCLRGEVEVLAGEEDFWVQEDSTVDWLRWQLRPWHDSRGEIGGLIISSTVTTEHKLLQQKIRSTEEQMRAVFAGMNELVFTVELNSDSISILPTKFFELYDNRVAEEIIVRTQQLFDRHESNSYQDLIERVLQSQTTISFEYSLQFDRALIWFSVNISPISDSTVIWIARDVTNRKQTEAEKLYLEQELAQITLESIGDGVITTDAWGQIQYLNPIAEQLTGWSAIEAIGKPLVEVFQLIDKSTQTAIANPIDRVSYSHKVCKLNADNSLTARNGIRYEIEGLASPIMNHHQKLVGTAIVFRDVTKARQMARKLSWQANHDSLTKLYNRHKFEEFVVRAIDDSRLHQSRHSLCYLDLDRFKVVNDTCGHAAGDELLRQVTKLLQTRIHQADIFARLGGDEFGIIFDRCPVETAVNHANELRKSIEDFRFIWQDKVFRIGVSIGLVEIEPTTRQLGSLLNSADAACYIAKQQGGNRVHLGRDRDLAIVRQQNERQWVERINYALENNHLRLYAQKIAPLQKTKPFQPSEQGDRLHYEILLRLRDRAGNIILPGAFLPAAERYGLMPAIDRWVISNFLAGYETHCQSFLPAKPTAALFTLNLSGASINNQEFGNFLRSEIEHYAIAPQTICFEITETVAITNFEQANVLIGQLKKLGCSIALDDFGSGMSSFNYLKNLPIDYLKIDGSFVTNIAGDALDYATVECFHHLSQIMNIKTIAEFVENQTILEKLQQIGVDYVQGYGIERPKPLTWE